MNDTSLAERNFRVGACHAAEWLVDTARAMSEEHRDAKEISERLATLKEVLMDWRNDMIDMPDGQPWEWTKSDIESLIAQRKSQW